MEENAFCSSVCAPLAGGSPPLQLGAVLVGFWSVCQEVCLIEEVLKGNDLHVDVPQILT